MLDGLHGARVPRPVADVPPPALADGEAVAKAWLLELLAEMPLERAPAVPVARLAARGPALCAALLRAVGAQAELARLSPAGDGAGLAASAGELAGAGTADAPAAARAVAALRRALWASLVGALPSLDGPETAARVAHVADVVCAAVLDGPVAADLASAEEPSRPAIGSRLDAHRRDGRPFAVLAVEAYDAERLAAAAPADANASAAAPHGAPLRAALGLASCPEDGTDAHALARRADERLFSARAAGVPLL
jgi:hypothetical protein